MPDRITVKRLDRELISDFYQIHSEECGAGWCRCVAWWTASWKGWADRTAEENRVLRDDLFARGEFDGYLLYRNKAVVGWCQCGPRDRLEKLRQSYDLAVDGDIHAITCFFLAPVARGRGWGHLLLRGLLEDLRKRGVGQVEAFPRRGDRLPAEDVWMGPEPLFIEAGFDLVRDDPERPVYRKAL